MSRTPVSRRRIELALAAIAIGAAALAATGCYERVVSSRGIGTSRKAVQKPYRSDTALDRAYDSSFGPPKKTFRGADPVE